MRKRTKGPSGVGMRLKKVWRERAICVTEWHSLTISGTIWAAEQPADSEAREGQCGAREFGGDGAGEREDAPLPTTTTSLPLMSTS